MCRSAHQTQVNYHLRLICKFQFFARFWVFKYMCWFFYYLRDSKLSEKWESSEPPKLVKSFEHQSLDLRLKPSIIAVRNVLQHNNMSKFNLICFKRLKFALSLARWSIEMNEVINFVTDSYLKSNTFNKIPNT